MVLIRSALPTLEPPPVSAGRPALAATRIRPGARPVPKNTGSRDVRATPSGKLWKRKNQPRSRPKSQEAEAPGRANPSGGRSQEAGTPSLRPEEGTDTGRKELQRRVGQARRTEAKSIGLCVTCWDPIIPGETRCETCAEQHPQYRRQATERAAQQRDQPSGQASFF